MSINTRVSESAPGETQMPSKPGKAKKRGLIWIVLMLVICSIAGYAVWRASQMATAAQRVQAAGGGGGRGGRRAGLGPVPVVVTKVTRSSIPVYLNGLGNVTAYYTVTVKSRVDGQLVNVAFRESQLVEQGDLLAEIDKRPFEVQLAQAKGQLARDQALLASAKLEQERNKLLLEKGLIPKQQFDLQVAQIGQYEGAVQTDQAQIDNANLQITYSRIVAPITGQLGLRLVDPGNIIHATDANGIVTITQLQPISVLFTIPEDSLPQVAQKLRAGAHLPVDAYNRDNSKKLASGKLVSLDNEIDNTTGTSKLKAVFDNTDSALFPQQFVNIRLLVDTLANQLVVPNVAIQNGQQGTFVYVVDEEPEVHLKPVQVGITTATSSAILSGISDGDLVVVDGADRLIEGAVVRVRKPGELDNPPEEAEGGGRGRGRGEGGFKKGNRKSAKSDGDAQKGQPGGATP
jgi:multidrug efflux system membrane fusion protein